VTEQHQLSSLDSWGDADRWLLSYSPHFTIDLPAYITDRQTWILGHSGMLKILELWFRRSWYKQTWL